MHPLSVLHCTSGMESAEGRSLRYYGNADSNRNASRDAHVPLDIRGSIKKFLDS